MCRQEPRSTHPSATEAKVNWEHKSTCLVDLSYEVNVVLTPPPTQTLDFTVVVASGAFYPLIPIFYAHAWEKIEGLGVPLLKLL